MTRRLAALLLAALAGAPSAPASAAPALRTLTVHGVENAYTEVTFATRVRLETFARSATPPVYDTTGTYAAVYVEPVRGTGPVSGTILLRGMPGLSDVPFRLGPQGWLPPGRYRVHLLGDAQTTVRVRAAGLTRDMTVTTTRPSEVDATWVARGVAGVPTPVDRTIVPFTVRPRTLTVISSTHESTGFYGRRDVCVRGRSDGRSPCLEGNAGRGWYWGVYLISWTMGGAAVYHPGELVPGEYEVEFLDAAIAKPDGLPAFVMTVN